MREVISPLGGRTETGPFDTVGPRSGRDRSAFTAIALFEDRMAEFETIRDDFASLDDWEDRYRYVIELGHTPSRFARRPTIKSIRCVAASVRCGWNARRKRAPMAKRSCIIAATATRTLCAD